jgi:hypothetical protein
VGHDQSDEADEPADRTAVAVAERRERRARAHGSGRADAERRCLLVADGEHVERPGVSTSTVAVTIRSGSTTRTSDQPTVESRPSSQP